jgi:plastocyanin/mono/diheme cytochrome c family protein
VGAVQRLATVVIIGLTGLAVIFMLYIADESNRQNAETEEQDEFAIERGTADYLQYCLVCHGPAGEGYEGPGEQGTGRIGMPLGGSRTSLNQEGIQADGTPYAGGFAKRTQEINETIHRGRGAMPVWGADNGGELTDDQINNLTYMIQHVDWNEVYNEAVELNGGYPTAAPGKTPTAAAGGTPSEGGETPAAAQLEAVDIGWNPTELTIDSGPQTIQITNSGASPHDFTIDALGVHVELPPGETEEVPIDADAGTYEFYCSVPGHKEAGMVGTLTVK